MAPVEQQTSEKLSSIRAIAEVAAKLFNGVGVNPTDLLALIECAEIVRTDYLLLSRSQQRKALRALKVLE